jgi:hypothetical protein
MKETGLLLCLYAMHLLPCPQVDADYSLTMALRKPAQQWEIRILDISSCVVADL